MPGSSGGKQGRPKGIAVDPTAVRRARLEAGLSLAQVARDDLSRTAIYLVEKGKMRPSGRTLQMIADRTGRPISYFASDGGAPRELRAARDQVMTLVDTEQFEPAIQAAEAMLDLELPERIEADVRLAIGRAHARLGDGHSAYSHLVRARSLYEKTDDRLRTVEALDQELGALFLLADPKALAVGLHALDEGLRLVPPPTGLLVHILFMVGSLYVRQQQWEMAAKHFELGLQLARDEPNIRDVAKLHSGLGAACQAMGRIELSIEHARRARRLFQASGDPVSAFTGEHNLGETLLRSGELGEAATHFHRALQVCDEHDLRRNSRCLTLCSLGEVHLARNELERGRALLHEALSLAGELGERINEANAWRLLGRLHGFEDDVDAAGQLFARAIDLYTALEMPRRVHDCHVEYARVLRTAGHLEESLAHWEAAVDAVGGVKIPAQPGADVAIEARNA
jgi:tetratricopeptide (TPR) repeat protein